MKIFININSKIICRCARRSIKGKFAICTETYLDIPATYHSNLLLWQSVARTNVVLQYFLHHTTLLQPQNKMRKHVSIPLESVRNDESKTNHAIYLYTYNALRSNCDHIPLQFAISTAYNCNFKRQNCSNAPLFSSYMLNLDITNPMATMSTLYK